METCSICCERFNRSNHKKVICGYCPDFIACTSCTERYLLETSLDAHCMSCRKTWPRSFMAANFTIKFMNKTYKERRENLLFERERALMPETQAWVELEIELRKVTTLCEKAQFKAHRAGMKLRQVEELSLAEVARKTGLTEEHDLILKKLEMRTAARKEYRLAQEDHLQMKEMRDYVAARRYSSRGPKERRHFVRACPAPDCRGFLSTAWKCGVCEQWTCPDCHELKGPDNEVEHTCNPDNVETAKLLARDTRPCPKCAAQIFKISGCDQMWCTQCQTAFSWRTGNIETAIIHNPHYYDYMRTHGGMPRQPGDEVCGGLPDWTQVVQSGILNGNGNGNGYNVLACMHRAVTHAQNYLRAVYMPLAGMDHLNRERRIKYMMKELTEDKFKTEIQKDEKAQEKTRDIRNVIDMFTTVATDLWQQVVQTKDVETFVNSMNELSNYTNSSMAGVSRNFSNCVTPRIIAPNYMWSR